jgi:hypothetical protein
MDEPPPTPQVVDDFERKLGEARDLLAIGGAFAAGSCALATKLAAAGSCFVQHRSSGAYDSWYKVGHP